MPWPAFIALALICGSIPFGLLIARAKDIDIRKHGSGNIGATNVARVLGFKLGMLCFVLDLLKGFAPTFAAGWSHGLIHPSLSPHPISLDLAWWWLAVLVSTVLGHMFSPLLHFRGGKGVATGLGAMLGLWPYLTVPALGAILIWIIAATLWRYVSLASCLAALSLPFWVLAGSQLSKSSGADLTPFYIITSTMGLLVIYKHRSNIRRLIAGTENRLGARVNPAAAPKTER